MTKDHSYGLGKLLHEIMRGFREIDLTGGIYPVGKSSDLATALIQHVLFEKPGKSGVSPLTRLRTAIENSVKDIGDGRYRFGHYDDFLEGALKYAKTTGMTKSDLFTIRKEDEDRYPQPWFPIPGEQQERVAAHMRKNSRTPERSGALSELVNGRDSLAVADVLNRLLAEHIENSTQPRGENKDKPSLKQLFDQVDGPAKVFEPSRTDRNR